MSDSLITSSKLFKLLTSQPYFVWHTLEQKEEVFEEDNFQFNFPSFVDNPNEFEEYGVSFSQIQMASFEKISKEYKKWLKNRFGNFYELKSKSLEERAGETQRVINNEEADFIFNPAFIYEYEDYQALAVPALYDIKNKILYFNKYSGSTKRKDIVKMFFDTKIIKKLGVEVKEIALHVFATKEYKAGEIDFFETKYINTSTSTRTSKEARDSFDFITMQTYKTGMALSQKTGDPIEDNSIFEIINSNQLVIKKATARKAEEVFPFYDIDHYLKKIIEAKDVDKTYYPTDKDVTPFGFNTQWNELLAKEAPEYSGYNGKIVTKKNILENVSLNELAMGSPLIEQLINNDKPVINQLIYVEEVIEKLKGKVVWYDFEAFSLPFSPVDGVLPYNQVVSQVSVIVTENEETIENENLVLDPKNYTFDQFIELIDSVYRAGHYYVVYNKSYENARWMEMSRLLKRYDHPKAKYFSERVEKIIESTIDLAELFTASSKKSLPIIMIPQLKFKHSIKLLEKYITKYCPYLEYKIKEYQSLDIKQGMMAMETANYRALNIIGDKEWEVKVKQLQEYCENDVKAMIMVYYLIKDIYLKNK